MRVSSVITVRARSGAGRVLTCKATQEFDELCFDFGIELDEDVRGAGWSVARADTHRRPRT
jgi:hypothetical protein